MFLVGEGVDLWFYFGNNWVGSIHYLSPSVFLMFAMCLCGSGVFSYVDDISMCFWCVCEVGDVFVSFWCVSDVSV